MSLLLDKLDRAAERFVQPLGFGGSAKREPVSPILVLGAFEANGGSQPQKTKKELLDGAVIRTTNTTKKSVLEKTTKSLGDLMFGTWSESPQAALTKGADFEIFSSPLTSLAVLSDNDRTFIMNIELSLDEGLIRTIDVLPVSGFVIQLNNVPQLTLEHLMQIGRISTATSKPVFLHLSSIPAEADLSSLRDIGIAALIVELENNSDDAFMKLNKALKNMPQKPNERENRKVNSSSPYTLSKDTTDVTPDDNHEWDDD